jgi:prepilin-type N-terminal cleavage/methylation domain-containing protein
MIRRLLMRILPEQSAEVRHKRMDHRSQIIRKMRKAGSRGPWSVIRGTCYSGFTLAELLIVIAIVGIITAVVFGALNTSRASARDTKRIGDLKVIQLMLAVYYDANKFYPADLNVLVTDRYLPVIPTDPGSGTYGYLRYSSNKKYCLSATLEGSTIPNDNVAVTNANCAPLTGNYKVSK